MMIQLITIACMVMRCTLYTMQEEQQASSELFKNKKTLIDLWDQSPEKSVDDLVEQTLLFAKQDKEWEHWLNTPNDLDGIINFALRYSHTPKTYAYVALLFGTPAAQKLAQAEINLFPTEKKSLANRLVNTSQVFVAQMIWDFLQNNLAETTMYEYACQGFSKAFQHYMKTKNHTEDKQKEYELIKFFLNHNANPETPLGYTSHNNTALIEAASKGKHKLVRHLIAHGAQVNGTNARNETALHLAAKNGRIKTTTILLAAGADVKACNDNNKIPEDNIKERLKRIKKHKKVLKLLEAADPLKKW